MAAFAGAGNPFSVGTIEPVDKILDLGSGGGFDCIIGAKKTGDSRYVADGDMTREMLERTDANGKTLGLDQLEFRLGYTEALPVDDGWADVVTSNGVIYQAPDKDIAFREVFPGPGRCQWMWHQREMFHHAACRASPLKSLSLRPAISSRPSPVSTRNEDRQ